MSFVCTSINHSPECDGECWLSQPVELRAQELIAEADEAFAECGEVDCSACVWNTKVVVVLRELLQQRKNLNHG